MQRTDSPTALHMNVQPNLGLGELGGDFVEVTTKLLDEVALIFGRGRRGGTALGLVALQLALQLVLLLHRVEPCDHSA